MTTTCYISIRPVARIVTAGLNGAGLTPSHGKRLDEQTHTLRVMSSYTGLQYAFKFSCDPEGHDGFYRLSLLTRGGMSVDWFGCHDEAAMVRTIDRVVREQDGGARESNVGIDPIAETV